jgi:hypothetical protein
MIETTYRYSVYKDSVFQGDIENVVTDFRYMQTINKPGAQLTFTVGTSYFDLGSEDNANEIVDNAGVELVDNFGNNVVSDIDYEFTNSPIKLGNELTVTEYSSDYINGRVVFQGRIVKWRSALGSNNINVTAYSHGFEFAKYIITEEGDLSVSNSTGTQEATLNFVDGGTPQNGVAQTFELLANLTVSGLSVNIKSNDSSKVCIVRLELYEDDPNAGGAELFTGSYLVTNGTFEDKTYTLPDLFLTAGTYHFRLYNIGINTSSYTQPVIRYANTNEYANGSYWTAVDYAGTYTEQATSDMRFALYSASGAVTFDFTTVDTGAVVRQAMDAYISRGGLATYTTDTVELSGNNMTYTFNTAKMETIINKALAASPGDYYYKCNPSNNVLYFKPRSTNYDHLFVYGRDILSLQVENTIDEMNNVVYFVGGDTGSGENLLIKVTNEASVSNYGNFETSIADNRVTSTDTGNNYANRELTNNSDPVERMVIELTRDEVDASTIDVGDMVSITNTGSFIDNWLMQISELRYTDHQITITCGKVPVKASTTIEQLRQGIQDEQTRDNPATAS